MPRALAFGFDAQEVAATAGVAGAVIMATMAKCGVAAGALAVVALAVWQWSGGGGTAADPSSASPPAAPVVAAISDARTNPPIEVPAGERTPSAAPAPPPRAGADEIVVRVVDAASGQPVLAFGLREHMGPQRPMLGAEPYPLLHAGEHVDGRIVLPASAFVDRNYVAEDTAGAYLPSRWFAATDAVDRDGERTIEVRMTTPVEVRVKVVHERTGEAVAGTRVELIRPWIVPHAVLPMTMAAPSDRFRAQPNENAMMMNFMGGRALLLGDVVTDAGGVAVLRVPPDERLVLRLTGALHCTVIVEPWQAPAEPRAEVVIPVAMGAAIRGRVTPASALAALHARIPERFGQNQEIAQLCATGVRFQHVGSGEFRPPGMLGRTPVTLADDGSFELGGLAPGTWRMYFRYALNLEREAPGRLVLPQHFEIELPNIEALTDGELRIVDVDVSDWVPGTLRAQLPRDERMGKEGSLGLHQIASVGPPLVTNRNVGLQAAPGDRIEVSIPPARYLAMWYRPNTMTKTSGSAQLVEGSSFVLGELEVRARAVTAVDLTLDADTTSIQVFEADGTTPVRGKLWLQRAGWNAGIDVDANGAATFDAMPRGSELKTRFHRWNAERPNGPFLDAIDLGTIRADGKPIVLRLPPR